MIVKVRSYADLILPTINCQLKTPIQRKLLTQNFFDSNPMSTAILSIIIFCYMTRPYKYSPPASALHSLLGSQLNAPLPRSPFPLLYHATPSNTLPPPFFLLYTISLSFSSSSPLTSRASLACQIAPA